MHEASTNGAACVRDLRGDLEAATRSLPPDLEGLEFDECDDWSAVMCHLATIGWSVRTGTGGIVYTGEGKGGVKRFSLETELQRYVLGHFPRWRFQLDDRPYELPQEPPLLPNGVGPEPGQGAVVGDRTTDGDVSKILFLFYMRRRGQARPTAQQYWSLEQAVHRGMREEHMKWRLALSQEHSAIQCRYVASILGELKMINSARHRQQEPTVLSCDGTLWGIRGDPGDFQCLWQELASRGWRMKSMMAKRAFVHPGAPVNWWEGTEGKDFFFEGEDVVRYAASLRPDWSLSPSKEAVQAGTRATYVHSYIQDAEQSAFAAKLLRTPGFLHEQARALLRSTDYLVKNTKLDEGQRMRMTSEYRKSRGGQQQRRWLAVPGVLIGVSKDTPCGHDTEFGEGECSCSVTVFRWEKMPAGQRWGVRREEAPISLLRELLTEGGFAIVREAVVAAPRILCAKIPAHFYRASGGVVMRKVRPAAGCLGWLEGVDGNGFKHLLGVDWINRVVTETNAPMDEPTRQHMHAMLLDAQGTCYTPLPAGARKRHKACCSAPGVLFTCPARPVQFVMDRSSYSCYPVAAASLLHLFGVMGGHPGVQHCAPHIMLEGCRRAVGVDSNYRVTDLLVRTLRWYGLSLRRVVFDPLALDDGQPILAQLNSSMVYPHCIGFWKDMIVDPSEETTLLRCQSNIDSICGGSGAYKGIVWAYRLENYVGGVGIGLDGYGLVQGLSAGLRAHGLTGVARKMERRARRLLGVSTKGDKRVVGAVMKLLELEVAHTRLAFRTQRAKGFSPFAGTYAVAVAESAQEEGLYVVFSGGKMYPPPFTQAQKLTNENLRWVCGGQFATGFAWVGVLLTQCDNT